MLGRYRLHRPLGTGGFATVWLARDERLERDVAVKLLARDRVIGGRFEREARAAARLGHPGIVTLYEAEVDDEGAYLVSELVRGSTLGQLLEAGRLSDRDVISIGIALCDALEHAHRQGVVHRDVKPSNVLVPEHPHSGAGVAKLTDFGVARLLDGQSLTRTGDVVGTAGYMAPEQADGREAGVPADLYSLALVLYEALSGWSPAGASTAARRSRRMGPHLPPLRRHRRDLPRDLAAAIDRALHPHPRRRGTVAELRAVLAGARDDVEDLPGVVEPPWPLRTRAPSPLAAHEDAPAARDEDQRLVGTPRATDPAAGLWPHRAAAGAMAGLVAAWLIGAAFRSPPLPPAGAALVAFLAVGLLPRIGWLALIVASAAALSAQGRAGAGLLLAVAGAIPVVILPRSPTRWPLAVAAPALGAAWLAGAWPALAGRDSGVWRRAALGATGWVWILAAGLIGGHAVYVDHLPGVPARAVWMGSAAHAADRALWPVLTSGLLVPAAAWGLGAAVLPWILRGPAALRVIVAVAWSAGLASATATLVHAVRPAAGLSSRGVVLGAVAAAILALVPTILRWRRGRLASPDTAAGLA